MAQPFNTTTLLHDYPIPAGTSLGSLLRIGVGQLPNQFVGLVGANGWTVALMPTAVYWIELVLIGFIVIIALATRSIRGRVAVTGILVASLVLSVVANASLAETVGLVWQGRYILPLLAGAVVVGAHIGGRDGADARPLLGRCAVPIVVVTGVIQVVAVYAELRRFMVGVAGSLLLERPGWAPPLPALVLIAACLVAEVWIVRSAIASLRRPDQHESVVGAAPSP